MTPSETVTSLLVMTSALAVTSSQAGGVDLTLVAGSKGTAVVMAVVNRVRDRCIFSEDRLFLRRMAYVASRDGTDSATYSTSHNGGIWQVAEDQFQATQSCTSAALSAACQTILTELGIDWSSSSASGGVTWSDLRKPLYSGLAAALVVLLQLNGSPMPGDVTSQAQLWASAYSGNATEFSALAANATDMECSDKMDLVFILDSSGSVSVPDFTLMTSFAADVVQVMDVEGDAVRVAKIVYGTNSTSYLLEVFDHDDYTNSTEVGQALLNATKLGGGTPTHYALNRAAVTLYDAGSGARADAKKVVVLITDGVSTDSLATASSAVALKERGTTVFAIGVGNYNLPELQAVASSPTCAHVFTLTQFTDILSILTQIQISTCDASLVLTPGGEVSGEIPATPVEVATQTLNPGPNSTISVIAVCGELDIYVSYTERNPGPVFYEEYYNATSDSPASLTTRDSLAEGEPIHITVVAARQPTVVCTRYEWRIVVEGPSSILRLVDGGRDTAGRVEIFTNGSWGTVCNDQFGTYDAIVVCRMLGHESFVPEVRSSLSYGSLGDGTIWLDEVACGGAEASLLLCSHGGVGIHDCKHTEDVAVDCAPANASSLTLVRLVNGSRPSEGRLEVNNGGVWGTVCQDGFDASDAAVACHMLNFTGGGGTPAVVGAGEAAYGAGEGPIWMDEVECTGEEGSLFLCPHPGLGLHDCLHSSDVGLDCYWPLSTSASTGSDAAVIGGAVGGVLALTALLAAAGGILKKYLASRTAVQALKVSSAPEATSRRPRRDDPSSDDTYPIPGLADNAPAMRMPADTRLPPLVNRNHNFPALRL